MEIESLEVQEFFQSTLPLEAASDEQLLKLGELVEVGYRKRGYILTIKPEFIYLVRKGAIQIEDENEK